MRQDPASGEWAPQTERKSLHIRLTVAILSTAVTVWLVVTFSWAWNWFYSGSAILSLLIIYGGASGAPAFHSTPPWTTLATLNLVYAIMSTSWLQYRVFTTVCWPCIITTFLLISPSASNVTRVVFRRLTQAHFIEDEIAGFNLPALHFDVGLEGMLTIRGWTLSLSTLTIEAHGIEAAYNLTKEMHVVLCCDDIVVRLCRGISMGAIYGVLKREKFVVEHGDLSQPTKEDNANFEIPEQPLQSTSHASGDHGGLQVVVNSSKKNAAYHKTIGPTEAKASGDSRAQSNYNNIRREIHLTSPARQCREQTEDQASPQIEQKIRAATCEKLEKAPSVPHRSNRSIKASTILHFIPLWVRRLFSRMPFLLRLVLMPLSYLHPIKIASASISASGSWMAGVMRESVYSVYDETRDDIRQLEQTVSDWMNDAFFCVDLSNIQSLVQVSARASQDMVMYPRCASSMLMRIEPGTNKVAPAMSIDGADATVTIPPLFLPSHEHLIPPRPSAEADSEQREATKKRHGRMDGTDATGRASLEEEDQADIGFSVHLSFPAVLDRAMVDFFADLIKSTIVLVIEDHEVGDDDDQSTSNGKGTIDRAMRKVTAGAHDMNRSIKKGMKKAAFRNRGDHRIPKIVNKIAEQLEALHGNVGYSGSIPVPLGPYRGSTSLPTKLMA